MSNPGAMYLQLSEGPDDLLEPKWSPLRLAGVALVVVALAFMILFIRMPGVSSGPLKDNLALASKGPGKDGGGEDDSSGPGPGGDGNDDDDGDHHNTAGQNTAGTHTADADHHGDGTRGHTGHRADMKTGKETKGNTDRPGLHTGASTKGETDPGDHTGKTERR